MDNIIVSVRVDGKIKRYRFTTIVSAESFVRLLLSQYPKITVNLNFTGGREG